MRMPENEVDPAGNTQQFRAFVQKGDGETAQPPTSNLGMIISVTGVIVVLVVVAAVFFLR
jgi:hypothetical protein